MTSRLLPLAVIGAAIGLAGASYTILTVQDASPPHGQMTANETMPGAAIQPTARSGDASRGSRATDSELRRDLSLLSDELRDLRQKVLALDVRVADGATKGDLAALRADLAGGSSSVWDSPSGTSDDGPSVMEEEASSQELLAQAEQNQRRRLDAIAATFQAERIDRRWAAQVGDALWTAAQHMPSGVQVSDVQCRSTMCRLDIQHATANARAQFEYGFLPLLGNAFRRMTMDYTEFDDGSTEGTVYLVRAGDSLPTIGQTSIGQTSSMGQTSMGQP